MSNSKRVDISIGAYFDDGWQEIEQKVALHSRVLEPSEHKLKIQTHKRKNKIVTVVGEFHIELQDAKKLLSVLKKSLSCGGTYKDRSMEFQGNSTDELKELLVTKGYNVAKK